MAAQAHDRNTAKFFPGSYADASTVAIHAPGFHGASFSHQRRSLGSRVSQSIATRLSIVGLQETPRAGTVAGVIINTFCNVMGAGVLALPLATRNASVALALALLAYVAVMSAYAVYCLVVACEATGRYSVTGLTAFALCSPRTFEMFCAAVHHQAGHGAHSLSTAHRERTQATPNAAWPRGNVVECTYLTISQFRHAKLQHAEDELRRRQWRRAITVVVETIVFCSNVGTLIMYARVMADSMPPVMGNVCTQLGLVASPILLHEAFWLLVSGCVFFVLSCARNMEELRLTSLLGFLSMLYIVLVVIYRFHTASWSQDPVENARGYPSVDPKARGTIDWMTVRATALRTMSTYGVAFGYHFNVPYFYAELGRRTPPEMMKTVAVAFPVIISSYAVTGVLGYLTFGELVASREVGGNIVCNYPDDDALVNVGRLGLFAHFACVFPIVSVCARRSLHRLAMTALTWPTQSALMRLEVEQLKKEEASEQRQYRQQLQKTEALNGRAAVPSQIVGGGGDNVAAMITSMRLERCSEQTPLLETRIAGGEGSSPASVAPLDPADLDHDVGAPADTTRLAIVTEALLLVGFTVVLAGKVSGISLVIDVIGALFGVFLILIVPGVVGTRIFANDFAVREVYAAFDGPPDPFQLDSTSMASEGRGGGGIRFARAKYWLCALSAVSGIAFTAVASTVLVLDHMPWRIR